MAATHPHRWMHSRTQNSSHLFTSVKKYSILIFTNCCLNGILKHRQARRRYRKISNYMECARRRKLQLNCDRHLQQKGNESDKWCAWREKSSTTAGWKWCWGSKHSFLIFLVITSAGSAQCHKAAETVTANRQTAAYPYFAVKYAASTRCSQSETALIKAAIGVHLRRATVATK